MSLAAMSVLVVAIGILLTFAMPRLLSEGKGLTMLPAPTKALAPIPWAQPDLHTPTPAPVSRVYQLKVDADGRLLEGVQVISDDGMAILHLTSGTRVLGAGGQPAASVTVTWAGLGPRLDVGIVGLAYDFGPGEAILDPPGTLTIYYDPRAYYPFRYPSEMESNTGSSLRWQDNGWVYMAYMTESGALLPALTSVHSSAGSATAEVDHLGTITLYIA